MQPLKKEKIFIQWNTTSNLKRNKLLLLLTKEVRYRGMPTIWFRLYEVQNFPFWPTWSNRDQIYLPV